MAGKRYNKEVQISTQLRDAIARYLGGDADDGDRALIDDWYRSFNDKKIHIVAGHPNQEAETEQRLMLRLRQFLADETQDAPVRKLSTGKIWLAAAILLISLATALYFYRSSSIVIRNSVIVNEIGPGGNKATLILADGTEINLDSAKTGIQIKDEDINYNDGTKIKATIHHSSSITYNSLTTPKGGQYQIILPDGTKVWLNAASTLKYPSKFTGDRREVELNGEAYFSVTTATDKPFTVKSRNQEIRVIGTEFNLSSYNDENKTKTTLISGAVQINMIDHANSGQSVSLRLNPGEQAVLNGNSIHKNPVKIEEEIAWKSGKISLANKTLKEILTELSRWYDIEVVYQGAVPEGTFFGRVNRSGNISSVLHLLESAGVNYRLEGRKLVVGSEGNDH